MNYRFRNVICPWQSIREIRAQAKTVASMLKKLALSPEEEDALLYLDRPDRIWVAKEK